MCKEVDVLEPCRRENSLCNNDIPISVWVAMSLQATLQVIVAAAARLSQSDSDPSRFSKNPYNRAKSKPMRNCVRLKLEEDTT
jgi:hypothetical protein